MYRRLGAGRLTTGERLDLGLVEAPDPEWTERIAGFLFHKPPDYGYHIEASLARPLDGLETLYYLGSIDGQIVTSAMLVGARGFGILGHVFTAPAFRRRGAYRQLMSTQMEDARRLGYRALTLGTTNHDAFRIYLSFGFHPITEGSGTMLWLADPATELIAPGPTAVRPTLWDDWAPYSYATIQPVGPDEPLPRSPLLDVRARALAQGSFLAFQVRRTRQPGADSRVLVLEDGAVVGWCHLSSAPTVLADGWLLDLHVLPGFESELSRLTEGIGWPEVPVAFLADARREEYQVCLSAAGFREAGSFPGFVARSEGRRALGLWVR